MSERLSHPSLLRISADKRTALACGEQDICYKGDDACPYGRQATENIEPFSAVILHHNPPYRSLNWLIGYQICGDDDRGGHFGYHFYVAKNGEIFQGAPLTVRTNHIKGLGYKTRREFGRVAQNRNSIGITCVSAERPYGFSPTTEQTEATVALVYGVCSAFDISLRNVFGHGEIQSDRHPGEGTSIAELIRKNAHG